MTLNLQFWNEKYILRFSFFNNQQALFDLTSSWIRQRSFLFFRGDWKRKQSDENDLEIIHMYFNESCLQTTFQQIEQFFRCSVIYSNKHKLLKQVRYNERYLKKISTILIHLLLCKSWHLLQFDWCIQHSIIKIQSFNSSISYSLQAVHRLLFIWNYLARNSSNVRTPTTVLQLVY